jgi:hypothetical protein
VLEEEFQGADHTINVSDFVIFPSMEDLLTEVVTFVQYRKRKNESSVRLFYRHEKSVVFYKEDPLYIIDGIMSTSTEDFLSIKPEDLLTIKIINNPNKLAQLGTLGQNGIIFVETKKTKQSEKLARNIFPITGLSAAIVPAIRDYQPVNRNHKMPDLRSTLYWNPDVKNSINESYRLKFFLSDDTGPVKIIVRGFTADGRYVYAEKNFTVEMYKRSK